MSLRSRLTLLYTLLMAGILLLSCVAVFVITSILLIKNIDRDLRDTARIMIPDLQTIPLKDIKLQEVIGESPLDQSYFQIWGADGKLIVADPPEITSVMDIKGLKTEETILESVDFRAVHLQVHSLPIRQDGQVVGIFQIADNLSQFDNTQRMIAVISLITILAGSALTSFISWRVTDGILKPLEDVVNAAFKISEQNDLSKRIPMKSKNKDEVGVLIEVMNKTFERLEELLMSQQRFLADVSHDLRTPLTVIKGNAELMRKTGWADAESLDSIDEEVNRLTHMVGDLMLLVQAESGQLPLEWKPVRLDVLIEDVVKHMRPLIDEKQSFTLGSLSEVWVKGDAYRLKQVFENLVSNAIQYTPRGGKVDMELRRIARSVFVDVKDTGLGISSQDLSHIFERFFRAEPSRLRTKESGFGLGLAISNWIVKQHHGEILIDSKMGVGSTFTVKLPITTKRK